MIPAPPPPPAIHAAPFPGTTAPGDRLRLAGTAPWPCGEGCVVRNADKDGERPGDDICDAYLDTTHFRVHYATTGDDRPPGYPDLTAVQHLAQYLEEAYRVETEGMGLDPPLPDGTLGGGQDLIDCYFYDLESDSYDGIAYCEGLIGVPHDCPDATSGYMEITTRPDDPDFDRWLHLVAAHELFHLVQFARDAYTSPWLMESTACHAEAIVWPGLAYLCDIWNWFNSPHLALWSNTPHRKYAPHFWIFLETHLQAPDIVAEVWRRCCDTDWQDALREAIAARGSTFNDELQEFAVWNALTDRRDDGRHYPGGHDYPPIRLSAQHHAYPVVQAQIPDSLLPQVTGSDYIRCYGPASANALRVTVTQDPAVAPWRRIACVATRGAINAVWSRAPDPDGTATLVVPDWGLYDDVTVVVTTLWDPAADPDGQPFTYDVREEAVADPAPYVPARLVCAPNPAPGGTTVEFAVPAGAGSLALDVYDPGGRLVRRLTGGAFYTGWHRVPWDGTDAAGRRAPADIYLLRLHGRGLDAAGRVLLER